MKRDVLVISVSGLLVGVVVWVFWGNPETARRERKLGPPAARLVELTGTQPTLASKRAD